MGCASSVPLNKKDAAVQTTFKDLKSKNVSKSYGPTNKNNRQVTSTQSSSNVLTSHRRQPDRFDFRRFPKRTIMHKPNKSPAMIKNKSFCNQDKSNKNKSFDQTSKKFSVLVAPIKSESDKKDYKVIRLENGLTACLIADKSPITEDEDMSDDDLSGSCSDSEYNSEKEDEEEDEEVEDEEHSGKRAPEQKMAAAALCIGVGSFSDPKHIPGMAHFLEHMVFMGSEKFPQENDFDAFIKKGGGSDNASTDAETTCFYFECLEKNLYEALDKFAQFFISPLMKRDAMTREREAIESEFQMAIPSDTSRKDQLLCCLAKEDSPVNSFSWGNLITLRDNISDDDLYTGLHEFRKRHYSAHRMTLAIQARLPMDDLEKYVLECFEKVPNNHLLPEDFSQYTTGVFETPEFAKLYYIKPLSDVCEVELTWALPSLLDKYKSKPHQYISYLMGDEGKGSILSYLRKKVWALGTSIGNGESGSEHNSMYALFTVTLVLTQDGLDHLYEVIEVIFAYINKLRKIGPQRRIFDEIKTIADTSFRFATEETAVDMVEDLCESMQFYPPEDYIAGSELYYEYDPEAITMVLNHLQPDKMNVMVTSTILPPDIQYNKIEKWFGTEYTEKEIPRGWIQKWDTVEPYPELDIPGPNPYLTNDFSILPEVDGHPDYPEKIISNPLFELWYRKDQKFKLPLAYYYFYLISPLSIESSKSATMVEMLFNLLVIDITEEVYPATSAGLTPNSAFYEKGIFLKVSGYNEKLPILINVISKYLASMSERITIEMFEAVKDKLIKNYFNKLLKPSTLAKDIRLNMLVTSHYTPDERYESLRTVTFEDMKLFAAKYMRNLYVKVLVQGNVAQQIASTTVEKFIRTLGYKQLADNEYPQFRVCKIPRGERCARLKSFNKEDANSIITNYYQTGIFSIRNNVILDIIMLIIEEPLFDILRTKEQLGYHVYASVRDTFGVLGFTVTVNAQATKNTTQYVDERIEAFLKHTRKLLKDITEEDLEQTKEDLIKMKQCADVDLKEEVERNWTEIVTDDYIFDRLKQEINMINEITLDELRNWWDEHNSFGNKGKFRKLTIQVVGYDTRNNEDTAEKQEVRSVHSDPPKIQLLGPESEVTGEERPEKYFVDDLKNFKSDLPIYLFLDSKK